MLAGCTTNTEPPGPSSASPSETGKSYVRAEPGKRPDIIITRGISPRRWTGPWPYDLASLSLTNAGTWLTVELTFSRFELERPARSGGAFIGDYISIWFDAPGDAPGGPSVADPRLEHERELFVPWGNRGRVLGGCEFPPRHEHSGTTVTFHVRRSCVSDLRQVRARAFVYGDRREGEALWSGEDQIPWTDFARPGEAVTFRDPHE